LQLAIPLAAQQLGFQLMGSVDTALLGHYSDAALAASGVGNSLLFAITSIGMGIVMGLDSIVPQAIGAGRLDDARRGLAAGIRLAVLVGLAATVLVVLSPLLLSAIDVPDEVATDARIYIHLRSLGIVPFLLSIALRSYLAARSTTRPLIVAVIAGNLANAVIDIALIFGIPAIGIPAMGVAGAAIATVVVQVVIIAVYFRSARALDDGEPRPPASRADMAAIVRYGGPVGGQLFAEVGIFGLATVLAASIGTLPAAAHSIALTLASFTFAMAIGIGSATSVRVGHAIGAGDRALARHRGVLGLGLGVGAMALFAAMFVIIPGPVAQLFTDDPAVVLATVPLLQIAALFQLSDGAQAIAAGALRGIGDTRATFVGNVIGHYAIGLPISLGLAFGVGLGAPGLWWGLSAGLTVTAAYLIVRFLARTRPAPP
ncbi:MAG: MATE family efflux transporter, partial [Deltaproteobacteria bacterium]|nr:MATE family efflux transporter [Deltaproteobacteria bacterium]